MKTNNFYDKLEKEMNDLVSCSPPFYIFYVEKFPYPLSKEMDSMENEKRNRKSHQITPLISELLIRISCLSIIFHLCNQKHPYSSISFAMIIIEDFL